MYSWNFNFWEGWKASERRIFYLVFGCFVMLNAITLYHTFLGEENIIKASMEADLKEQKVVLDSFSEGGAEVNIYTDVYLIIQHFSSVEVSPKEWTYISYAFFLLLGIWLWISIIPTLSYAAYLLNVAAFFFFISTLQLEILNTFPFIPYFAYRDKLFLILVFLAYVPLSYFFYLRKYINLGVRFISFGMITAGLVALAIYLTPENKNLLHYFTHYNHVAPIVITVIICIWNGQEFLRLFVFGITNFNNNLSEGTVRHLLIMCTLYFFNLVYSLLYTRGYDWGILFVHPFYLFSLTSILSVWGTHKRAMQVNQFISEKNLVFLYIALGLISISYLDFNLVLQNTASLEVYEDSIIFVFIGMFISFLGYFFFNYADAAAKNLAVYKVYYKNEKVPYYFNYFITTLIVGFLLIQSNYVAYDQSFSGYYNNLARVSEYENNSKLAKQYYRISTTYSPLDFSANYRMASIFSSEPMTAIGYLEQANKKFPKELLYRKIANIYTQNNKHFQALFVLKEAIEKFPKNGHLYNNIALIFDKIRSYDSALYYFDLALKHAEQTSVIKTNTFLLWNDDPFFSTVEDIFPKDIKIDNSTLAANLSVFLLNKKVHSSYFDLNNIPLPKNVLSTFDLCYLFNYATYTIQNHQDASVLLERSLHYDSLEQNTGFSEYLKNISANIYFNSDRRKLAFITFEKLLQVAPDYNRIYPYLLGMRYLQLKEYKLAADWLGKAWQMRNEDALYPLALATSRIDLEQAQTYWGSLNIPIAKEFIRIYESNAEDLIDTTDDTDDTDILKYRFLSYKNELSLKDFMLVFDGIEDAELGALSLYERFKSKNEELVFQRLKSIHPKSSLYQKAQIIRIDKTKTYPDDYRALLAKSSFDEGMKAYYLAKYAYHNGHMEEARKKFRHSSSILPYHADTYIQIADSYNEEDKPQEAYVVLLNAHHFYPSSTELIKAYVLQAISMNYDTHANHAMEKLMYFPKVYKAFLSVYEKARISQQRNWEKEQYDNQYSNQYDDQFTD